MNTSTFKNHTLRKARNPLNFQNLTTEHKKLSAVRKAKITLEKENIYTLKDINAQSIQHTNLLLHKKIKTPVIVTTTIKA